MHTIVHTIVYTIVYTIVCTIAYTIVHTADDDSNVMTYREPVELWTVRPINWFPVSESQPASSSVASELTCSAHLSLSAQRNTNANTGETNAFMNYTPVAAARLVYILIYLSK